MGVIPLSLYCVAGTRISFEIAMKYITTRMIGHLTSNAASENQGFDPLCLSSFWGANSPIVGGLGYNIYESPAKTPPKKRSRGRD